METIRALPAIYTFLENGQYTQAISIINQHVEVLAPYINFQFPDPKELSQDACLFLAKLFLLRKEYEKSIGYALQARNELKKLESFYFESLIYCMMDHLVKNDIEELRIFILDLIKNDPITSAKLGYLLQIRQFDLLRECLIELSNSDFECRDILLILTEVAPNETRDILVDCSVKNDCFFEHVIDSLVMSKRDQQLKDIIVSLPWQKMYAACFYLEDTHQYKMDIENENASLILSGQWKQEILSNFLFKNNKTNFKFLESMSKARTPYMALVNSFMNAGTTNDSLYRNNKNLVNGRDWNRFLEFGSLGMIHQGNIDPFEILKEVLPSLESTSGEPGSLLALGIMNAGRDEEEATEYFLNWLDSPSEEMVFGACLGLGLNTMTTCNMQLFEKLKALFAVDNTIAQESALYAIGLLFSGSENAEAIGFVESIHSKTDFPRVKRVCCLAVALINVISEGRADMFAYLSSDDSSIRSMGLLSLGAAYAASSDLNVIGKVLPFVNDGDDDVKRSAVLAIALIGYGDIEIKNSCLAPLAENHNMFVRATSAVCLGFFSAGMCDQDVCVLLEAMLYDNDDLVRHNACIGAGLALMQANPTLVPNYKRMMDRINYLLVTRAESPCVKIGASLGRAISETSGKAAIFSLKNFGGQVLCTKLVGALLFFHSWDWYPLIPCISLCHHPTPLYFFDENLDETNDYFINSESYYDYLVKLPELKKSRKFKPVKATEQTKDILEPAKNGLTSGDRLTYRERIAKEMGSGIFFKEK